MCPYSMKPVLLGCVLLSVTPMAANAMTAQNFVQKASIANQFEIESSKLAMDKAQNDDVKSFAEDMVKDHERTGEKLTDLLSVSESNLKPATNLDSKHQKLLQKLKATSATNFDRQYVAIQTDAHKEAVGLFSDYAQSGEDRALKNFAKGTLPTLRDHLQHVQNLNADR